MLETFPGFLTKGANFSADESLDDWLPDPGEGCAWPSLRLTVPELGRGPLDGGNGGGAPSLGGGGGGADEGDEPGLGGGGGGIMPSLGGGSTGPSRGGGGGTGPSRGGGSDPAGEDPSPNTEELTPTF